MISHPFEIKPSATNQGPDVLMITWRGVPAMSVAEIYLPVLSSKAIIALADKVYGRHRLTATDANTIQFPAGDLTLIPIPAGTGRYAGLLSVEVHPSLSVGRNFTVSVRQLNQVSAKGVQPPPPVQIERVTGVQAESQSTNEEAFSWREVQGAFQYTVTAKPAKTLLSEQERLLAWLKWRLGVIPAGNRWLPVLKRYLTYTEGLVWNLGKDPNMIPPSEVGSISGPGSSPGSGSKPPIPIHIEHDVTGKVIAIHYDRFGDFCAFVILSEAGHEHHFRDTEHEIERLVREAWVERTVVRVFFHEHDRERLDRLVLLR
jgi:hypothetical protein